MNEEPKVKIGIYTSGPARMERAGDVTVLKNMLIGKGFHWERSIEASLPGDVELTESRSDGIGVLNTLPLETYLMCVAASEMNPSAPPEFLKAHAVIARSWAMRALSGTSTSTTGEKTDTASMLITWEEADAHTDFDFCSDDHCQRYQGLPVMAEAARKAIAETRGIVLTDARGEIADARYSKCCGGRTELFSTCWDSRNPDYLRSFPDPNCDLSSMEPMMKDYLLSMAFKDYDRETGDFADWKTYVSKQDVSDNLRNKFGRDLGCVTGLEVLERGPSGRVMMVRIEGTSGNLILGKELMVRRLLAPTHLYSSAFEIAEEGDGFMIEGHGWGHGVGLCQTGAARMALDGASCEDILQFYYPNTKLTKIYV